MATHFYGCVFNFSFLALLFVQQDNKLFKTKLVCFFLFIKTHPKEKRGGAIVYIRDAKLGFKGLLVGLPQKS